VVKEGGFFVECGGLDGERLSNTAFLERQRHWQGLLIEMDPFFYTQLLGKNRRVWSLNACLSPYKYFTKACSAASPSYLYTTVQLYLSTKCKYGSLSVISLTWWFGSQYCVFYVVL